MIKSIVTVIFVILLMFSISFSYAESSNVQIDLHYKNNDRVSAYELFFIIYPEHEPPFRITPDEIPAQFTLESGYRYNAELFVNDMFIEGFSIDLISQSSVYFEITVPTPSGLLFSVLYDDGYTGLEDATISIKSHIGNEWRSLKTAYDGKTYRTWIQSTTYDNNFYTATISVTENINYVVDEIHLKPGESKTLKIKTPWPKEIDQIRINTFDHEGKLLKKSKNHFLQIFDGDILLREQKIPHFGIVTFTLLPVGEYQLKLVEKISENIFHTWADEHIVVAGDTLYYEIHKEQYPITDTQSCNCVSFRFDDIQDFWLTEQQHQVIEIFENYNAGLTLGVVGKWNGDDHQNIKFIKSSLENENIELANHGWVHENFSLLSFDEQQKLLIVSNDKILQVFGTSPNVFIPPFNAFNQDTLSVLETNGFSHISSSIHWDEPNSNDSKLYHFPQTTEMGYWDNEKQKFVGNNPNDVFLEAIDFFNQYGYAVIMMHPQDFSIFRNGEYTSELDYGTLNDLQLLLDMFEDSGLDIVPIGQINQKLTKLNQ